MWWIFLWIGLSRWSVLYLALKIFFYNLGIFRKRSWHMEIQRIALDELQVVEESMHLDSNQGGINCGALCFGLFCGFGCMGLVCGL
jgi:hypothetical protein